MIPHDHMYCTCFTVNVHKYCTCFENLIFTGPCFTSSLYVLYMFLLNVDIRCTYMLHLAVCMICCRYRLLLTRAPRTAYARDLTRHTLPQGVEMGVSTSGVSDIWWVVLGFCMWSSCPSFICLLYSVCVCDRIRGFFEEGFQTAKFPTGFSF